MVRLKDEPLEELWSERDKAWQQKIDKLNNEVLSTVEVDKQMQIG